MNKRLLFEAVFLIIAGVAVVACDSYLTNKAAAKIEIFYFFSPDCPNCKAAKPIMDSLKPEIESRKIKLVELNVKESNNWSPIYTYLAQRISRAMNADFLPIPTAVVRQSGRFYTFIGKESIPDLNDFLHRWARTKRVTASLKKQSFNLKDCISCHTSRNLALPSTYNCSYCCHFGK